MWDIFPPDFREPYPETASDLSLEDGLSRQGLRSRSRGKTILQGLLHMGLPSVLFSTLSARSQRPDGH